MSLAHGRSYLAIPGPSVMPDRVLQAMHTAAPNIYAGELVDMMPGIIDGLKSVARTKHFATIYIANGHGAWEAALSNVVSAGDKVLSLCTGRFGHGWAEMATSLGLVPQIMDFGIAAPIDADRVKAALLADTKHEIKAVLATHVDTSSSIKSDIAALGMMMNSTGHPALLMVDCIASFGAERFEMDAWGVDVMVGASQKGLMVPPGLGFVFFNDRAVVARHAMPRVSNYWDWEPRRAPDLLYQYFGGTPPTHHLYGVHAALGMIADEGGIEAVWARHEHLARAIWAAFEAWSKTGPMTLNVTDPAHRSCAVTAAGLGAPNGLRLRSWCEDNMGVTLGIGLGMGTKEDPDSTGFFRLGHMGHVNAHMVMGALSAIEAGLIALDIPHGSGALDAMAKVMAEA